ncbi:MAG TPA: NAD(P)H-hydrate dehydratase [Methylomirabilota bacterium]|nr:NAD(P)H-hydrate dehydratase [Methylomirabilota bacterium]
MLPVFTAEEMRRLDRRAIAELGIPSAVLMENAGRGAGRAILAVAPALGVGRRARVAVVCGKGGNAGDGFVVARWLKARGLRPEVWLAFPPDEIAGDAALKLTALRRSGGRPALVTDVARLVDALRGVDLVVDALLGTGARGAPEAPIAAIIGAMNAAGRPIVALDVPSGLPADGGPPAGPAVRATLTVTFAGLKQGLVTGPGVDFAGRVEVVDIGVPAAEVGRGVSTFLLEASDVARQLPPRSRSAHKGTLGHVLIVAGSLGKTGAAALAAGGALRSGAGLVTVATAASQQPVVAGLVLEAMTAALPETAAHSVALKAVDAIAELAAGRDAVAIGPGLGLDADTQALARELVRTLTIPVVVDADALTALAGHLDALDTAPAARCLTPHPGEMARLLGATVTEVERDRVGVARRLASEHRAWVVLKGAGSLVAAPSGEVYINPTGNPGMASGGTGDVLTGMAGALLARGLPPVAALQTAVYVHGRAGDLAAARLGQEALIAGDLVTALPEALVELQSRHAG